ncbi:hypothetical protein C5B42_00555 [Candidatus Cerribacteria bacterium 'Amazon FNV 2010 28 9']|uniref:Cupin type-2 domain-containing protein n=1 Tax=Candidatus Cerribacteria bacterium 'Amazon FNV 2010 28 9' TaxID=2081795 RepID=A0A317JU80_9BACT|nr:MAG: hypothetical protein C5B42_00555 [Candidatus Cerribacteria bacterium 'Amazon FNV 2010 28 9']
MEVPHFNVHKTKHTTTHDGTVSLVRLIQSDPSCMAKIATMNYAWLDKDGELKPHLHPDSVEYFFFLQGLGSIQIGDVTLGVESGDFVTVPMNTLHTLKNSQEEQLIFLTLRAIVQQQEE